MILNVTDWKGKNYKRLKRRSDLSEGKSGRYNSRPEQYSRKNCLLIHGIPENKNKNTDVLAMEVIETKMDIKITDNDIDRTHRIGKPIKNGTTKPVIIKFVRYNDRKKIFSSKKLLKDSRLSITENLTAFRMKKLTSAREIFGFRNVWTVDGMIYYSENGSEHAKIYYN